MNCEHSISYNMECTRKDAEIEALKNELGCKPHWHSVGASLTTPNAALSVRLPPPIGYNECFPLVHMAIQSLDQHLLHLHLQAHRL